MKLIVDCQHTEMPTVDTRPGVKKLISPMKNPAKSFSQDFHQQQIIMKFLLIPFKLGV
jgi:hypothetical protein